jgi:hypothetical protein
MVALVGAGDQACRLSLPCPLGRECEYAPVALELTPDVGQDLERRGATQTREQRRRRFRSQLRR